MINDKQIKQLQEIVQEDFGIVIPEKEAFEIGQNLVELFNILAQSEYEQPQKKD